jgi:phage terminase Nu1 subunit (DNA packaging protein)
MLISREMIPTFCQWAEAFYGVALTIRDEPRRGEHVRFMLGDSITLIREHDNPVEAADTVEVWCADGDRMKDVEQYFLLALERVAKEIEDEESDNRPSV